MLKIYTTEIVLFFSSSTVLRSGTHWLTLAKSNSGGRVDCAVVGFTSLLKDLLGTDGNKKPSSGITSPALVKVRYAF